MGTYMQRRYAIELGKVVLRSDKPITEKERDAAIRWLLRDPADAIKAGVAVIDFGFKLQQP